MVALSVFSLPACGGTKALPPLVRVEGKVTLAGKPLNEGAVTFVPADESLPPPWPEGAIAAGGTYTLQTRGEPGAPAGTYRAIIEPGDDKNIALSIDPRYCNSKQTPLQIQVSQDPTAGAYDLALKSRSKR
jgi:hypothetical protein